MTKYVTHQGGGGLLEALNILERDPHADITWIQATEPWLVTGDPAGVTDKFRNLQAMYEKDNSLFKNFKFVTCNYDDGSPRTMFNINVTFGQEIPWWTFHVHSSMCHRVDFSMKHSANPDDHKPEYLFTCLMRTNRTHRMAVLEYLIDSGLINHGYVSWCNTKNTWHAFLNHSKNLDKADTLLKKLLPYLWKTFPADEMRDVLHGTLPGFYLSAFDIVTETSYSEICFTEKTWRPILHGKPFVILGGRNTNAELKKLGFEIFDEFFDIDAEKNIVSKTHTDFTSMIDIIRPLEKMDTDKKFLNHIKEVTKEKVLHNQNLAVKMTMNDAYIPDEIKEYFKNPYENCLFKNVVSASRYHITIDPWLRRFI